MTPGYDLLASGLLLGGSSVALALTALCARRAAKSERLCAWNTNHVIADRKAVAADRDAAKKSADLAQRVANAAMLDRLLTNAPDNITVTRPETVDEIPIPVPKPKLYAGEEVEGVPGSRAYGEDAGDVNVIEFGAYWRDHGDAGA
jgi:hypothetical protein